MTNIMSNGFVKSTSYEIPILASKILYDNEQKEHWI